MFCFTQNCIFTQNPQNPQKALASLVLPFGWALHSAFFPWVRGSTAGGGEGVCACIYISSNHKLYINRWYLFTYPLRACGSRPPDSGGHCRMSRMASTSGASAFCEFCVFRVKILLCVRQKHQRERYTRYMRYVEQNWFVYIPPPHLRCSSPWLRWTLHSPESKQKTPLPESGAGEWYRDLLSVRDEDYFT